jgi:hypothetical protein
MERVNKEDGGKRRWGDGEMGRWGDGEMGRWGDKSKKKSFFLVL